MKRVNYFFNVAMATLLCVCCIMSVACDMSGGDSSSGNLPNSSNIQQGSSSSSSIEETECLHEEKISDEKGATCTSDGYVKVVCGVCGEIISEEVIESSGHSFENGVCGVCGEKQGGEDIPTECTHEKTIIDRVEATCTEDGYIIEKCADCEEVISNEVIESSGHSFENGVCINCGENEFGENEVQLITDEVISIQDFLASNYTAEFAKLRGVVSEITDDENGSFVLTDESGNVPIIDLYANVMSLNKVSLSAYGIALGDTIEIGAKIGDSESISLVSSAHLIKDLTPTLVKTVYTASELNALIGQINAGKIANDLTILLGANIDMQGVEYTPITEFRGVLDGMGYAISNLNLPLSGATITITDGNYVQYDVTAIGLIASAYDASVCNLKLINVTANYQTEKQIFVGALIGYAEGVTVTNCEITTVMDIKVTHSNVTSQDTSGVAGVIGYSLGAYAKNITLNCDIAYTANSYEAFAGAMLGVGNICIFDSDVTLNLSFTGDGFGHTGSVIGMERTNSGSVISCLFNSAVKGELYVNNPTGYDWGEVGQGYLFNLDGSMSDVNLYNEINVTKTNA